VTISQEELNRALGLPSTSPLTPEQAARRIKEAFDAQEEQIRQLRELFEQQLNRDQQGR